jgi:hypothetical protein
MVSVYCVDVSVGLLFEIHAHQALCAYFLLFHLSLNLIVYPTLFSYKFIVSQQIQEAPGRTVETRCTSGGIDHSFINYLVYSNKLRSVLRVRTFPQGEGAVNTLGGLNPDTVKANITGGYFVFCCVMFAFCEYFYVRSVDLFANI